MVDATNDTAIVEFEAQEGALTPVSPVKSVTAHRSESIAAALDAAYAKASTLQLTPEESQKLVEDFPDEAFRRGAQGKKNLIYIEHAYLRQRLNQVLGVGAAVPVRRREWTETWDYRGDDGKDHPAVGVYVDLVLLVRGCVVAEAIGDSVYYPDNAMTNYSDALESAKSAALRRCCKEFGVGLQAWMKGWVDEWKQRNGGEWGDQKRPQQQPKAQPAKKIEPPPRSAANFEPPKDWPDTEIHDLKAWIDTFSTAAHFKTALGMLENEPALVGVTTDWEVVLTHFKDVYKAKYQTVGTAELNASIKAALDKMEADKAENAQLA